MRGAILSWAVACIASAAIFGSAVSGAAEDAGAAAESLKLETVLQSAARNSPMVRGARHRWLAAAQKRAQAVALPDPQFQAQYFFKRVDDKLMLSATETLPWPNKLIIAGRAADQEAEAARLRYDAALRDALADVKEVYFELYYIDRAQTVTAEIEKLYDRYAALAAGGQEVAKPKLPELFRAQSQRAQLGYDLILLNEMRTEEAERLRAASGADARVVVGRTEDVAEPVALNETLDRLHEIAAAHNQELAAAGADLQRAEYQTSLARRAWLPDLTLGAGWTKMNKGEEASAIGGFSLPLWFPKYRAQAREADEMRQAAQADQAAQKLRVRADLAKAYFNLNNSSRLVRLYRVTLLPQARQALQSAEELYRLNQASLASVLETTATVQNFELARLRATADYYQNVARLERVLGTALELKPETAEPQEKKGKTE